MNAPFKMIGKSPMMKKLIGKQHNLPEELKAKIEASPAKKRKISEKKTENKIARKRGMVTAEWHNDGSGGVTGTYTPYTRKQRKQAIAGETVEFGDKRSNRTRKGREIVIEKKHQASKPAKESKPLKPVEDPGLSKKDKKLFKKGTSRNADIKTVRAGGKTGDKTVKTSGGGSKKIRQAQNRINIQAGSKVRHTKTLFGGYKKKIVK